MNFCRKPRQLPIAGALPLFIGIVFLTILARASQNGEERFKSPDERVVAVVAAVGAENSESRVSIFSANGAPLRTHDFSSSDAEHGYAVDGAQWTRNSQYFVFRMRSSGGHSPMFAPVIFWSRKANRFYSLNSYTADQTFSVVGADQVKASTWPDMHPATVSLRSVKKTAVTELP